MIIKASIRLQDCTTNERRAFVGKGWPSHGIAKGAVRHYIVEGVSWADIRRVLKTFNVMGFTAVSPKTVENFTEDIGSCAGRLRPVPNDIPAAHAGRQANNRLGWGVPKGEIPRLVFAPTPWAPCHDLPNFEMRLNEDGYREVRPFDPKFVDKPIEEKKTP